MFRSATFKLTMWYLAIVMAISLIFSAVLYGVATGELDRSLHLEGKRISKQYPVFQDDPMLHATSDYSDSSDRILWRLIGLNVVVLVGAGWASYWLARRTLEPIEEAHEQQKRFTADVSHELRTPLTALKMESEVALLNTRNGKKELRQTLASNLEEVGKLEALINNLLRLTRLEAEQLEQQFTSLNTRAVVDEAIEQVKATATDRQIKLDAKINVNQVSGDQASLTQLLVILLDNAIKYSPAGSTVHISGKPEKNQFVFGIKDEGAGIDKVTLEHVFDRFYRGKDSSRSKSAAEGFGLGLSIARMIADLHNGEITITSRPKHGTTVVLSLPIASNQSVTEP